MNAADYLYYYTWSRRKRPQLAVSSFLVFSLYFPAGLESARRIDFRPLKKHDLKRNTSEEKVQEGSLARLVDDNSERSSVRTTTSYSTHCC